MPFAETGDVDVAGVAAAFAGCYERIFDGVFVVEAHVADGDFFGGGGGRCGGAVAFGAGYGVIGVF